MEFRSNDSKYDVGHDVFTEGDQIRETLLKVPGYLIGLEI